MPHLHHVVLFTLREGADADAAIAVLEASRPDLGLVSWTVRMSLDQRKGRVIAEAAVFEDEESFQAFRASPAHQAAGRHMAEVSDWVVADWVE